MQDLKRWLIAGVIVCSSTAMAQDTAPERKEQVWKIGLGGGAMYRPDYEGSDDYEVRGIPVVNVSYRDFILLRGGALMIDALHFSGGPLSFGPLVKYDDGRQRHDNPVLRALPEVGKGADAGLFAKYQDGRVSLGISALKDISNRHQGTSALIEASYMQPLTARLLAQFEVSATWADDKYTQAYFGITRADAQASGLRQFVAQGGVKDAGTSVSLHYLLSEHWRITGRLAYRALLGDAADSPLVEDVGSKQQTTAALIALYEF